MTGMRKPRLVLCLFVALWIVAISQAQASGPGQMGAAQVSEQSYRHFLDDMLYTHDGDNRAFGPEHDLAQANIVAILESYGLDVALEPVPVGPDTYYNVVGTKLGTVYPDQEYVVGAHYDSVCYADCDGVSAPGADDNASGVALVLEAARVITQYDSDYTIRFVAFDREEQGLYGSYEYVDAHSTDNILGMLSPDMIAYDIGNYAVEINCQPHSGAIKSAMTDSVLAYGLDLNVIPGWSGCGSDHCPFEQAGIPACEVIENWGNPLWHNVADSVDTPNYIDYTFATKITRSVVGFLIDAAVVHVPVPSADYTGDGNVDAQDFDELTRCYTGPDMPPTDPNCLFFDFLEDNDIDCLDAGIFAELWTAPGDAPMPWQCQLEPAIALGDGSRCLEITPPPIERPVALLIAGDPEDPAVSCLSLYVQPDGRLGETPVFQMWDVWGTMHICEAEIFPDTNYDVWCNFGEPGTPTFSAAAGTTTGMWADTAGIFEDGQWGPPNNDQGIMDVVAILDAFRSLPGAPPVRHVDLVGMGDQGMDCSPDQSIDMVDTLAALDAFRGIPFRETANCPLLCP